MDELAPPNGAGNGHKITFNLERYAQYYRDIPAVGEDPDPDNLLRLAHAEIFRESRTIRPFRHYYQSMDNAGLLKVFTARDEGRLIGLLTFIVTASVHHKDWQDAAHNIFFVRPEFRGWIPLALLKYAEKRLHRMGVNTIFMGDRIDVMKPRGPMYERMGYEQIEVTYRKELGGSRAVAPKAARSS